MQNTSAFDYPQEPILLVRPCLIVICRENRPAAKLLSGLLYHARNCSETQETFTYQRRQEDLVKIDLCGEISTKTLHDVAIPALKLLGFIDVDQESYVMRYTIYLSRVRQALTAYKQGREPLEKVLIRFIKQQLEKVLIVLEKVLIDKKNFQLLLEKFLIVIGKISNCRGRKAHAQAISEAPEISRDTERYIGDKGESNTNSADATSTNTLEETPYVPDLPYLQEDEQTEDAENEGSEEAQRPGQDASQASSEESAAMGTSGYEKTEEASEEEKPAIPQMPPLTAKWCPETAVQIVEFKLQKYYRPAARTKQLNAMKRMFKEDPTLTREQFETAYDERNDDWWHDHKGLLHCNHMVEKDRVHEMLDRIEGRRAAKKPKSSSNGSLKRPPTREEDPYSIAALLEEQNPGYHARKEMMSNGDYSFADFLSANS